jgi:small-conductance mechanosensitive channel
VDPERVVELLKSVAANHPGLAKEPAPQAYVINFASGAVSFQLRAWTDRYEDWNSSESIHDPARRYSRCAKELQSPLRR